MCISPKEEDEWLLFYFCINAKPIPTDLAQGPLVSSGAMPVPMTLRYPLAVDEFYLFIDAKTLRRCASRVSRTR